LTQLQPKPTRKRRTRTTSKINKTKPTTQKMEVVITEDTRENKLDTFSIIVLPFLYLEAFVKLILQVK